MASASNPAALNSGSVDSGFTIFIDAVRDEASRSMTTLRPVLAALDSYAEDPSPSALKSASRAFNRLDMTMRSRIRDRAIIMARGQPSRLSPSRHGDDSADPPTMTISPSLHDEPRSLGSADTGNALKVEELFGLIQNLLKN